jgi:adenosylcobinamide-phosphate synthase
VIRRRALVVTGALVLDAAWGELPNRWHPVAWFGRGVDVFERSVPHEGTVASQAAGVALLAGSLAAAVLVARLGRSIATRLPVPAAILVEAMLLKQALAFRALLEHARAVQRPLGRDDLVGARAAVSRMVSRDVSGLDAGLVASAAIESVAENLSDSVVAPVACYLAGGLEAAYAYRVTNTLDAMVGYRAKGWFGTPSARLDDALNLVPSRLTALLLAVCSLAPRRSLQGARADHARTPSPNSGWPMAAMAHGLGVRLEKPLHHVLNPGGRTPAAADIGRANWVAAWAVGLALALTWILAVGGSRWRR